MFGTIVVQGDEQILKNKLIMILCRCFHHDNQEMPNPKTPNILEPETKSLANQKQGKQFKLVFGIETTVRFCPLNLLPEPFT